MTDDRSAPHSDNGTPPPPQRPYAEDEVSLLDILLVIARNKQLILRTVLVFAVLGVTYALVASEEYTSTAQVVREETEGGVPSGLSGGLSMLGGLGINLGGLSSGLTAQAYPEILKSREVRLGVVRDTFYFAELDTATTFVDYVDAPPSVVGTVLKYTIGLPGTLLKALQGPERQPVMTAAGARVFPTEAEEKAIKAVDGMVTSSVNAETGLMSVSVTAGSPRLAAAMASSFLAELTNRITTIRTEKARRNLAFMEQRFEEAERELRAAEEALAQFMDRNSDISSAQLRTEQERLQRQVSFKSELYRQLQGQVTQARIELQRSEPILTVLEAPVPPMSRSAPKRTLIVLLSIILGGFLGIGAAFVRAFFNSTEEDAEEQEKLEEIKTALVPSTLIQRIKARL